MFLYERIVDGLKFLFACPNNSPAPFDAEFDEETLKVGDDIMVTFDDGEADTGINQVAFRTTNIPVVYKSPLEIDATFISDYFDADQFAVIYSGEIYGYINEQWEKLPFEALTYMENYMSQNFPRKKFYYQKLLDIYCNGTPNEETPVQIPLEDDIQITPMVGDATLFEWFEGKIKYLIEVETESGADVPTISVSLTADGQEINSGDKVNPDTIIAGTVTYTGGQSFDSAYITVNDGERQELQMEDYNTKFEFAIKGNTLITIIERTNK